MNIQQMPRSQQSNDLNNKFQSMSDHDKRQLINSLTDDEIETLQSRILKDVHDPEIIQETFNRRVGLLKNKTVERPGITPLVLPKTSDRIEDRAEKVIEKIFQFTVVETTPNPSTKTTITRKKVCFGRSITNLIAKLFKNIGKFVGKTTCTVTGYFHRRIVTLIKNIPLWSKKAVNRINEQNFNDVDISDLAKLGKDYKDTTQENHGRIINQLLGVIGGTVIKNAGKLPKTQKGEKPHSFAFESTENTITMTSLEIESMKAVLEKGNLTPEENSKIERYVAAAQRSLEINEAIMSTKLHQPGQEIDAQAITDHVGRISQKIMFQVRRLNDGEAVFLDVGHKGHAMRMSIERKGQQHRLFPL